MTITWRIDTRLSSVYRLRSESGSNCKIRTITPTVWVRVRVDAPNDLFPPHGPVTPVLFLHIESGTPHAQVV